MEEVLQQQQYVATNAVVTLDLTAAQDHKVTATGICTITCTGVQKHQFMQLELSC